MSPFVFLIALYALLGLVALVFMLLWEYRRFARLGKQRAWLTVRMTTIPVGLATAALVVLPARATSGMEGLAVFYLALLFLAPAFWFGCHWLAGRCARPALTTGESAAIAASPILLALALAALAHVLQPFVWTTLRHLGMV